MRRSTVRTGVLKNSARRSPRCVTTTKCKIGGKSMIWSMNHEDEKAGIYRNLNWVCLVSQEFTRFLVRQFAGLPKEDSVHSWLNSWHCQPEQVARKDFSEVDASHPWSSQILVLTLKMSPVSRFANRQVVTYLAIFCLKWGRKGEAYSGSDTAVSWQPLELTRIGKMTVKTVTWDLSWKILDTYLNLFDNPSASISFRCLLLVALHRSLWLFHGSRCSPASPKKWRGHPQWDPQVVEWLIA